MSGKNSQMHEKAMNTNIRGPWLSWKILGWLLGVDRWVSKSILAEKDEEAEGKS